MILLIAAAISTDALGAPSTVTLSDSSSTGLNEKTAGVVFSNTGAFYRYFNDVPIAQGFWLAPQVDMGDYEIRATLSSGDTPTGTFDTWNALSTTHDYTLQTSTPEEQITCNILIEIRWTGNNVVQDSATYTLTANGPAA